MLIEVNYPNALCQTVSKGHESISVGPARDADESALICSLFDSKKGTLVFPVGEMPSARVIARFLGKVGLEVLAQRALEVPAGLDDIVNCPGLEDVRRYVRFGSPAGPWPFSHRRIYPPDHLFRDVAECYQVLHEFDTLVTSAGELYIVVAIFGEEFALNLGAPSISGYREWLQHHNNASPLYADKNTLIRRDSP